MFRTILIADGDEGLREDLGWSLRVQRYRVLAAGTTVDTLTALALNEVDLLVVGIGPRFDGRVALEQISGDARYARLPILVITSAAQRVPNLPTLRLPFTRRAFVGAVRSLIGPARIRPMTPIPGELSIQDLVRGVGKGSSTGRES